MRVLISSVGTRGDVQPAVGLAVQLRQLGHDVRLCVPPNFVAWVAGLGFEATSIGIEMRAPRPGTPPAPVPDLIADQFEVLGAAAVGCDVLVGAGLHQYAARSIAEWRGARYAVAAYCPASVPSADTPPPGVASEVNGPAEIRRLWAAAKRARNDQSLDRVNANRARLGLRPVSDVLEYILGERPWLACDKVLGPASMSSDLDVLQTGAWLLPDGGALPSELERFLGAGAPPIYLGLGSMPAPPTASQVLIGAARAAGKRVVLSAGWAELARIDDGPDCIVVGDVNHQALFSRVAAVVHHGGAGTTTAAALAGAPQVITPMFSDQFYWGRRVAALGLGAVAEDAHDLGLLTQALEAALRPETVARARSTARRISTVGAGIAARAVTDIDEV